MIKQLQRIGGSNALLLDKPILELLGIGENDQVQLVVDSGCLIVTPANPHPISKKQFNACLNKVVEDRRDVLQKLA